MPEIVINHKEARQLAEMKKNESNLARAYLELFGILQMIHNVVEEVTNVSELR